jgi:hypothetical protein
MKKLLLLIAGLPLVVFSQSPDQARLVGIIKLEDQLVVLVESPSFRSSPEHQMALQAGQREGSLEVLDIDATRGEARIKPAAEREPRVIRLKAGGLTNGTPDGLVFDGVGIRTMMRLLGEYSERTVLQHPSLPAVKFSLRTTATNRAEIAQILREALEAKDIVIVPDGGEFLLAGAKGEATKLNPKSAQLTPTSDRSESEVMPRGSILFAAATVPNVLSILAEFRGEKLESSPPLPDGKIYLTMETALTRAECRYALETLIGWQGIELVPDGDGLVRAVSTSTPDK